MKPTLKRSPQPADPISAMTAHLAEYTVNVHDRNASLGPKHATDTPSTTGRVRTLTVEQAVALGYQTWHRIR